MTVELLVLAAGLAAILGVIVTLIAARVLVGRSPDRAQLGTDAPPPNPEDITGRSGDSAWLADIDGPAAEGRWAAMEAEAEAQALVERRLWESGRRADTPDAQDVPAVAISSMTDPAGSRSELATAATAVRSALLARGGRAAGLGLAGVILAMLRRGRERGPVWLVPMLLVTGLAAVFLALAVPLWRRR